MQDPNDPLHVTWTYDAGVDNGTLPDGTLSLTIYQHGQVAAAGGCTINVGLTVTGGTCSVELPQYGEYDVTVTYTSSTSTVAPSTQTETDTISAPVVTPPAPIASTTTLSVTMDSQTDWTSPPPFNTPETETDIFLSIATSDPYALDQNAQSVTFTLTDITTGATATSAPQSAQGCDLRFGGPSSTTEISGCGIAGMPFAYGDSLAASASFAAADNYTASSSGSVQVWSGSLPPGSPIYNT